MPLSQPKPFALQILPLENYVSLPIEDGVIRSLIFSGLWLDVSAMLNNQMPQVLARLKMGLESELHQAFMQRLAQGLA